MDARALTPLSFRWRRLALAIGPGLVVMLADTDAGSVITAAQSGAERGYQLLAPQLLLIPVLFMAQELTIRLGLGTGKGFAELLVERFGRGWAWLAMATLAVSCFGALVTQMSGLAGIGQLYGVPTWESILLLVALILGMVCTGTYHQVERIAIALGLFELAFLVAAWQAAPGAGEIAAAMGQAPLTDGGYLYLLAANLGTCIVPWAIFYQQSAIIDKGLRPDHIRVTRLETLAGATFCQVVTAAVLVAGAGLGADRAVGGDGVSLDSVPQIALAFTAVLGPDNGRLLFAMGLGGGALVATIVVCLTAAWAFGEVAGLHHSLEHHPSEAPWFYGAFALLLAAAGGLVASGLNLVRLSIAVGVVNALLLPVTLAFLYRLAGSAVPEPHRLKGAYGRVVAATFVVVAGIGLYAGIAGVLA